MPEIREGDLYQDNALEIKYYLESHYEIYEGELNMILYSLIDIIVQSVERSGIIPSYSYVLMVKDLTIFDHNNTEHLGVHCGFMPLENKIDDLVINNGYYSFPESATSVMNLESGTIHCSNISIAERSLT